MDVGFIGLGQMGGAIALNLVKAGHSVTVYNRTRAKAEALAPQGAKVAESPADACRRPVAITMLADDHAVEGLFFGDGNGLAAMGQGAVHISMSTISVALSDRLAEAHRNAGQTYVAAPCLRQARGGGGGEALRGGGRRWSRRSRIASHCSTPSGNGRSSSATSRPRRIWSSSAATSCSRR